MGVPGTPLTGGGSAGREAARLRRLEVALDSAAGVFAPGDPVTGSVCCDVVEATQVHGCRIVFTGAADVSWTEVGGTDGPETVVGRQTFFQTGQQLFGKGPEEKARAPGYPLRAGFHQFQFHFQLPAKLPSSFEHYSDTGRVKARIVYSLRVDVENAWRTASHSRERHLMVMQTCDLNCDQRLCERVCLKKDTALTCCCFSKGRIRCELSLPKTGYVPGETMDIGMHLINSSSACVESTHITFQQRLTLTAGGRRHVLGALIFSISGQRVRPGSSGFYHDVIHIPPLPPSGRHCCQVLSIEYIVKVQIEASRTFGQSKPLELCVPVVIGSVPLKDSVFSDTRHVVPCFAHFDFHTGDIVEHNPAELESATHAPLRPVYRYYKTERRLSTAAQANSHPPPADMAAEAMPQNGIVTSV